MLFSDAILRVRAGTLHDSDTQYTDTQLLAVLVSECRSLRRWLCTYVPELCEVVFGPYVVPGGIYDYIPKNILVSNLGIFERLVRVEKLMGSDYYLLDVTSSLEASTPGHLCVREMPDQLQLSPASQVFGTYRVAYLAGLAATCTTATDTGMPSDLDDVMIERACAWARQRHGDEWQYHTKMAEMKLEAAHSLLRSRYGAHGKMGLKRGVR
jgi:hypothetical protein